MNNEQEFIRFLLDQGYLPDPELLLCSDLQAGESPGDALVRTGVLSKAKLAKAVRHYLGIREINLTGVIIDPAAASLVSEEIARRHTLIPYELSAGVLRVAMYEPTQERALRDVRMFTGLEVEPAFAEKEEIEAAIRRYLLVEQSVARLAHPQASVLANSGVWAAEAAEPGDFAPWEEEAPALKFVYSVLQEAIAQGVSDIHWEPREEAFLVRYRLDGKLLKKYDLVSKAARSLVSCLKVMAQMNVAERRIPQDGRMSFTAGSRCVDLRMSSMPTVYGEKIVIRLLDPEMAQLPLQDLGMRPEVQAGVQALLQRPNGLLLVVGPTGSGKTTTLYALLRELNAEEQNIISIEEPVEYRVAGVNQVQVNLSAGLSFPVGLKHILRQDPDIIMIGEIRDQETAGIAITASLTGHLVLSTLHTNTAAEALTRLIDMGAEPYLLAAAVSGVLSQRLVRRLCVHCKTEYKVSEAEKRALGLPVSVDKLYRPGGCPECLGTGYRGRVGIHEFLLYNQEIKELVLAVQNAKDIEQQAIVSGMLTVYEDGMLKAGRGITSAEEVIRVTSGIEG